MTGPPGASANDLKLAYRLPAAHTGFQGASARSASRSSEARSLSAVVARARGKRFWSVSRVQS
jgi:hypothetical protein